MLAYMTALSERHAKSLLNPTTGEHHLRSVPVIRSEIWKEVQRIDTRTLMLTFCEADAATQKTFDRAMDAIAAEGTDETSLMTKIAMWQDRGQQIKIARTSCISFIVPTTKIIRRRYKIGCHQLMDNEAELTPLRVKYQLLTSKRGELQEFYDTYPGLGPEHMLDIMDSFCRLTPLPTNLKCEAVGEDGRSEGCALTFKCPCRDCFIGYACSHNVLFSAVWDSKIRVLASQSVTQLKDREGKKTVTPFNFEKKKAEEKGKERAAERWHPTMCEAVLGVKHPVEGDVEPYDTSSSVDSPKKKRKRSKVRRKLIPKSRNERADADADADAAAAAVPRGGGRAKATAR